MTRTVRYEGADVAIEEAREDARLLDVARRELGIRSASAPAACSDKKCGACRLMVDGELVNACAVRWGDVREGAVIEAYESVAGDESAARAVAAFSEERPTRCRLCIGALGVTAAWLARNGKRGDAGAIESALESATCMCTGRGSLRRALQKM